MANYYFLFIQVKDPIQSVCNLWVNPGPEVQPGDKKSIYKLFSN